MLQFGMPTLIENRTLEDNIALCKELGLSFVELNMNFPEYQLDKMENVDWFYKNVDEAGIYYTIHLDENMNIADFNPLVREAYLETTRRTIEVAKQFVTLKNKHGKKEQPFILNMHMHHGIYITLPDKKVQMYERDFAVYMEYISKFVKLCEEWIGETDTPFICAHKDKLCHFHIHDSCENPPKDHLALGDGETDLVERLHMAKECNARCVLETKTIEALKRSVEWLKKSGLLHQKM